MAVSRPTVAGVPSTLFSASHFVEAWCAGCERDEFPVALRLGSGDATSTIHGVGRRGRFGDGQVEFGPDWLYGCPTPLWDEIYGLALFREALDEIRRQRLSFLRWSVRFDHGLLAHQLQAAGVPFETAYTHVLTLDKRHEDLYSAYSATRRNQIRKSARRDLLVRVGQTGSDVEAYCGVHQTLAKQKVDFQIKYSPKLINSLAKLSETKLLLAEAEGRVVAGVLVFVDGDSMMYWHGASNREFEQLFPMGKLLDTAIMMAAQLGLRTFNFGCSATEQLREYKESFGAKARTIWTFAMRLQKSPFLRIKDWMRNSAILATRNSPHLMAMV